jgi:hypothetical protein
LAKSSVDVPLLALFRAPAKQDDECLTILTEVNPAAGSEVELVLEHSMTDTFDVREIAERDPGHGHCYLRSGLGIQIIEPCRVRVAALGVEIFSNVDHSLW